jgi:hypothetical protein
VTKIAERAELRRQLKLVNAEYAVAASKGDGVAAYDLIRRMDALIDRIAQLTVDIVSETPQPQRSKRR